MIDDLRALSVRQPWAYSILYSGKDIENRTRCYGRRGLTLIHASAGLDDVVAWREFLRERGLPVPSLNPETVLERGGVIGAVDVIGCAGEDTGSPWWMGPRGYVLRNARSIPFIPCKGTVTPLFWLPPLEVRQAAARALGLPA